MCQCAFFGCYTSFEVAPGSRAYFPQVGRSEPGHLERRFHASYGISCCNRRHGLHFGLFCAGAIGLLSLTLLPQIIGELLVLVCEGKELNLATARVAVLIHGQRYGRCIANLCTEGGHSGPFQGFVILCSLSGACCIPPDMPQQYAQALGLSVCGSIFLAMGYVLGRAAGLLKCRQGRILSKTFGSFLRPLVTQIGQVGQAAAPPLKWSPSREGKVSPLLCGPKPSTRSSVGRLKLRLCVAMLSLLTLPVPVHAGIPSCWWLPIVSLQASSVGNAMAAPESWAVDRTALGLAPEALPEALTRGDDPAHLGRPTSTPLASTDVYGLPWPPRFTASGHSHRVLDSDGIVRLPLTQADAGVSAEAGWLGVIVLAPHCQPTEWAFRMSPEDQTEEDLLAAVLSLGPALYDGFFDAATPVVPPRYPGYAMVLVYNTVTLSIGEMGHVPVVLDLSQVEGQYYSTVLPSRMPYDDLLSFILPQVNATLGDFLLFVGLNQTACAPWADVRLRPGEVITVQTSLRPPISNRSLGQLVQPTAHRAPLFLIPRNVNTPGYCVMHARKRYVLHQHQATEGQRVAEAVGSLLDKEPSQLTMHVHRVPTDLDVQGHACAAVISVGQIGPVRCNDCGETLSFCVI